MDNGIRNAFILFIAVIGAQRLLHHTRQTSSPQVTRSWSITATNTLAIDTPCAASVTINPNPALQNQVNITAQASSQPEISQLASHGGPTALISGIGSHCLGASACTESAPICSGLPANPTLTLAIVIPPGIALSITDAQSASYTIGSITAPLTLNISGSGDVTAATANTLTALLSGSGDTHITSLSGPLNATLSDSGNLDISSASAPSAKLLLNGNGDVNVDSGSLGTLTATLSDSGDLNIPNVNAADTTLTLSADGDAHLNQITGNLTATLTHDGDLTAQSVAGNATLTSTGSGDITIPRIAGHLTPSNTGNGDFKINGM